MIWWCLGLLLIGSFFKRVKRQNQRRQMLRASKKMDFLIHSAKFRAKLAAHSPSCDGTAKILVGKVELTTICTIDHRIPHLIDSAKQQLEYLISMDADLVVIAAARKTISQLEAGESCRYSESRQKWLT